MSDTPTTPADGRSGKTQGKNARPAPAPTVPQNEIIRETTRTFLDTVDPTNPPAPQKIEQALIDLVNQELTIENSTARDKGNQMALLKKLTFSQIAQIMLHLHKICRIAPSGKNTDRDYDLLAMYAASGEDEGIYVTSEDAFRAVARQYDYALTTNDFREILAAMKDEAPRRYRCHDRDLIADNNGIFDYRTKELRPFDPELVFLSKSHVDYVPGAKNPVLHHDDGTSWDVESWMQSLSDDPEVVELLWEILGAIIRPHVRWNKSAWLFSEEGNNGKGTLCELMRNLTGPTAYASIPIADFSKDFLLEPLTRASAIIVDENDVGTYIDRAANLKAVITYDVISINRKFKSPIAYQFYGFMVQCLNEFPRIKDKSESFYRRQLFVPMTKNFKGIERRYIKDDYLHRDEVLQYVLHRVLNMDYYTLSEPEATKDILDRYKGFNDPVRAFWEEFEEQFTWDLLPFPFLYDLYLAWFSATSPSGSPVGRNVFIKDLLNIVKTSTLWYCGDQEQRIRPGQRMDKPETLIAEYELRKWYNPSYTGTDPVRKSMPQKASVYRGLTRITAGPAGVVTSITPGSKAHAKDSENPSEDSVFGP